MATEGNSLTAAYLAGLATFPGAAGHLRRTADRLGNGNKGSFLIRILLGDAGHLIAWAFYRETFAVFARLAGAATDRAAWLCAALFIDALLAWLTALATTHLGGE